MCPLYIHTHCINQSQNANDASMVAVEVTSTPKSLTAADVSVSISIVANLIDEVLNNSEVRMNHDSETLFEISY